MIFKINYAGTLFESSSTEYSESVSVKIKKNLFDVNDNSKIRFELIVIYSDFAVFVV